MRAAVAHFTKLMAGIRQLPLTQAVFSPIHGRCYTDNDDFRDSLAECLVLPVRFVDATRELHSAEYSVFIEAGALNALTRCVELTVPGVQVCAPLLTAKEESAGLRAAAAMALETLRHKADSAVSSKVDGALPARVTPIHPVPAKTETATAVVAPLQVVTPLQSIVPAARTTESMISGSADRAGTLHKLRQMYASALELPIDAFDEDTQLEAELGIDSLKQTSLLGRVVEEFGLPGGAQQMQVWDYPTLGRLADYILSARGELVG